MSILWLNKQPKFSIYRGPVKVIQISMVEMSVRVPPRVRPPPPNEEDYEPHINLDTYEGEFFQETHLSKKCFKKWSTSHQNIEVDSDSEPDFSPEPE